MSSLINVVGIQFRRAGKVYDFDGSDYSLRVGDAVVVDTDRGPSLAEVVQLKAMDARAIEGAKLKKIVRIASAKDLDTTGKLTEADATKLAAEKIKKLKLDMRVLHAEIQFSGNKIILYFSAPGRIDFRDLVKELAAGLRARVELKQVGARDEAKLIGGLGICGREFCCSSFLRDFVPVSIKMAKNQNLALNPTKISGGCGRLLCCLTYEDETYTALRKQMPGKGSRVRLADGSFGDVVKSDFLNQTLLVELETGQQESFKVSEVQVTAKTEGRPKPEEDWGEDLDLGELMDAAAPAAKRAAESAPKGRDAQSAPSSEARRADGSAKDSRGDVDDDDKSQKSRGRGRRGRRGRRGKGGGDKPQ